MTEILYRVGVKHKTTGEKQNLFVWAKNTDEATHKLTGTLIGYNCEYVWTGTGPEYENNQLVTRQRYPKYVTTTDGDIGVCRYFETGRFPVYRFPGGERVADEWEIDHGSDDRSAVESLAAELA